MNISRRELGLGLAAAGLVTPANAQAKPKLVLTGDMGNVATHRLGFLRETFDVVGIDIKRSKEQDLRFFAQNWVGLFEGASVVFHTAWAMGVDHILHEHSSAIAMTMNVIEACRLYAVPKLIFMSSGLAAPGLYGHKKENDALPHGLYGMGKVAVETTLKIVANERLHTASIRLGRAWPIDPPDTDFTTDIAMSDSDMRGLFDLAMSAPNGAVLGPFAAR